jgi:hypothetical protein
LIYNTPIQFDETVLYHPDFCNMAKNCPVTFEQPLKELHRLYLLLNNSEKNEVKQAFETNKKIEELCNGKHVPYKYSDLPSDFSNCLKQLYDNLWNKAYYLESVKEICGSVKEHFDDFHFYHNKNNKELFICPFCGLSNLSSEFDTYRDGYDHYLSQADYPFLAIDYRNLIPMCEKCNKTYKRDKDVLFNNQQRRLSFYPYSNESYQIKVIIKNDECGYDDFSNSTIYLQSEPEYAEKVDTWNSVFCIKERYKNLLKKKGKSWSEKHLNKYYRIKDSSTFNLECFKEEIVYQIEDPFGEPNDILRKAFNEYLVNETEFFNQLKY